MQRNVIQGDTDIDRCKKKEHSFAISATNSVQWNHKTKEIKQHLKKYCKMSKFKVVYLKCKEQSKYVRQITEPCIDQTCEHNKHAA